MSTVLRGIIHGKIIELEREAGLPEGQPVSIQIEAVGGACNWLDRIVVDPAISPGQPIIKVFLNPLIAWIWIGVGIIVFGTGVALVPNMTAALAASRNRVPAVAPAAEAIVLRGGD